MSMQPISPDKNGTMRFHENKIVRDLLDFASSRGFGLNEIACGDYTREDRQQLAQLIGYSLSGYSELSYVDDESFAAAVSMSEDQSLSETEARLAHLTEVVAELREKLREPMATLFGIHPDDLSEES
ncbi:MAG: hypothetical protein Q8L20_11110 [Gammaproteobacteria bacterium]|nr:hypothetical protein [Gammaproteobacteria bacterium]